MKLFVQTLGCAMNVRDSEHIIAELKDEYELTDDVKNANEASEEQERIADGYSQMCRDALEQFSLIKVALKEQRLNRQRLTALAEEGYNNLYKNL